MQVSNCSEHIALWLSRCLPEIAVESCRVHNLRAGAEREVWECHFMAEGANTAAVLTVFKPGDLETVNTSLPPRQAARKCALAMTELPAFGIPTPGVLGQAAAGEEAAVLSEKIEKVAWKPSVRVEAARILARIHALHEYDLSEALRRLARESDPREYRITRGRAPQAEVKRLVHGDYFSANILAVVDGLCVIDWETFGWGDPMWDLGFLVGADRDLPQAEIEAVVAEYQNYMPVNRELLMWHRRRWFEFWEERRRRQTSNKPDVDA